MDVWMHTRKQHISQLPTHHSLTHPSLHAVIEGYCKVRASIKFKLLVKKYNIEGGNVDDSGLQK